MRHLLLAFGIAGAAVTIVLVGRHGYLSADTAQDGIALAALLAIVALGGLVGHAVAAHLWPVNRGAASAVFLIAAVALLLNLSTSFEAIIGRASVGEAERAQRIKDRKDAESELADMAAELAGLRDHVPVTAEAVAAARKQAETATSQREAECETRGTRCRDREGDERTALQALASSEREHAITQRKADLEAQAAKLRARIASIPPTASANTMATGLARLFRLPETDALSAATWHKLAVAAIVELLIAAAFVAAELSGAGDSRARHGGRRATEVEAPATPVEPETEIDPQPVIAFLQERVTARRGSRVSLPVLYVAYQSSGYPALGAAQFGAVMKMICERALWPVEEDGQLVYLAGRRLKPSRHLKLIAQ